MLTEFTEFHMSCRLSDAHPDVHSNIKFLIPKRFARIRSIGSDRVPVPSENESTGLEFCNVTAAD